MKLRRTACRVDLEGVRQVVFRASGLLVRPAPQMAGADLMTGGLAGTGFRDNPKLGDGNDKINKMMKDDYVSEITPN